MQYRSPVELLVGSFFYFSFFKTLCLLCVSLSADTPRSISLVSIPSLIGVGNEELILISITKRIWRGKRKEKERGMIEKS